VPLTEMQLNPGNGPFFDSGTTLIQMPADVRDSVFRSMAIWCSSNKERCGGYHQINKDTMCFKYNHSIFKTIKEWKNSFPIMNFMLEDKPY